MIYLDSNLRHRTVNGGQWWAFDAIESGFWDAVIGDCDARWLA